MNSKMNVLLKRPVLSLAIFMSAIYALGMFWMWSTLVSIRSAQSLVTNSDSPPLHVQSRNLDLSDNQYVRSNARAAMAPSQRPLDRIVGGASDQYNSANLPAGVIVSSNLGTEPAAAPLGSNYRPPVVLRDVQAGPPIPQPLTSSNANQESALRPPGPFTSVPVDVLDWHKVPVVELTMPRMISGPREPSPRQLRDSDPVPDINMYSSHFHSIPATDSLWQTSFPQQDVVVVSAVNDGYAEAFIEMASSVQYWEPGRLIVLYDIGLSQTNRARFNRMCNVIVMPPLMELYPKLSRRVMVPKEYAWKAICIYDAVMRWTAVIWIDGGSTIVAPMTPIVDLLLHHGYLGMKGQDEDASRWIYQGTARHLGVEPGWFKNLPSFSGNTQGYVRDGPLHHVLVQYVNCSVNTEVCMAAPGSSLGNHRYDQSVLSILCYHQHGLETKHFTWWLAAGRNQLSNDLTKPSPKIVWTSRGGSATYRVLMDKTGTCG